MKTSQKTKIEKAIILLTAIGTETYTARELLWEVLEDTKPGDVCEIHQYIYFGDSCPKCTGVK